MGCDAVSPTAAVHFSAACKQLPVMQCRELWSNLKSGSRSPDLPVNLYLTNKCPCHFLEQKHKDQSLSQLFYYKMKRKHMQTHTCILAQVSQTHKLTQIPCFSSASVGSGEYIFPDLPQTSVMTIINGSSGRMNYSLTKNVHHGQRKDQTCNYNHVINRSTCHTRIHQFWNPDPVSFLGRFEASMEVL